MHAGSRVLGWWIDVRAVERRHKNHVDQVNIEK
jgi:hypothetical protein